MTKHDHTGSFPDASDEHSTSAEVTDAAAAADVASNAARFTAVDSKKPSPTRTRGVDATTSTAHDAAATIKEQATP